MALAQAADAARAPALEPRQIAQRDSLLNHGFELLRKGDRVGALQQFKAAEAIDPGNLLALKQVGYLELENGNLKAAAASFEAARTIAPGDSSLALQLGYIYDRLGQKAQAEQAFRRALDSSDAQVQVKATAAIKTVRLDSRPWYFDLYGSPLYDSRFDNGIAMFQARLAWRPARKVPVALYLGGQVIRDTSSEGGTLPIIFSDDVGLLGLGVEIQPRRSHFNLRTEANVAIPLLNGGTYTYDARADYRAMGSYYNRFEGRLWGPVGLLTFGHSRGERLFNDLNASVGFYSRYDRNGIAYLEDREGLRIGSLGRSDIFAYLKYDVVKDSNRDFYNNLAEGGPGVEFRPDRKVNLGLRVDYLRGSYFGIAREPNPYGPNYNDFRVMLTFGKRF